MALALLSEKDVLVPGKISDQLGVLLDRSDTAVDGVSGGLDALDLTVESKLALIGRIEAGNDLHESGLAGAVDAEERMDFAGHYGEVHAVERHDRTESLRYSGHGKNV